MIHIVSGNDIQKKSVYLKNILKENESVRFSSNQVTLDLLKEYSGNVNLFGVSPIVILDNVISEGKINFLVKLLTLLKDSLTTFIFIEDSFKVIDQKKFYNYATIQSFDEKKVDKLPRFNIFTLNDAFARRDKVNSWILYNQALENGIEPEAISGTLFWKIKTMIINGNKLFTLDELKYQSSELVSVYHKSHRGECDFIVALEQFILNSLSKK